MCSATENFNRMDYLSVLLPFARFLTRHSPYSRTPNAPSLAACLLSTYAGWPFFPCHLRGKSVVHPMPHFSFFSFVPNVSHTYFGYGKEGSFGISLTRGLPAGAGGILEIFGGNRERETVPK